MTHEGKQFYLSGDWSAYAKWQSRTKPWTFKNRRQAQETLNCAILPRGCTPPEIIRKNIT
jgi:hypothetical protein